MERIKSVYIILAIALALTACKKDDRGLVVSKIKAASELATTQVVVDKYVFAAKTKRIFWTIPINRAYFAAKTEATIKLGIDLSKLKGKNVEIDGTRISLVLPPIEVITFNYPFEKFKIDRNISDNAFLNKISVADIEEYYRLAELDIKEHINYMGVIEQAKTNTANLMENLLLGLGYTEIYIDFEESKKGIVPETNQAVNDTL